MGKLATKMRTLWEEIKLYIRGLRAQAFRPLRPGGAGAVIPEARLFATLKRANGEVVDLGLIATKLVTDAGVQYLVDALQSSTTDASLFKFHGSGTGTTAEAATDTALVTEVGSRVTGSQGEGASANIYQTVATISYTSPLTITEHGVFSASTAGTLLDRSVFAAINVDNGDSIEFTYELTLPSGG